MSRYHTTGRDNWNAPRQHRPADFGHGKIVSDDDKQWLPLWLWGLAGLVVAVAFVACLPEVGA